MKNLTVGACLGLVLSAATPALSQVQLFEQELAGLHPFFGLHWNSKLTQPLVGVDYSIEGRTTLGVLAAKPVKDSIHIPGLKAFLINPYAMFEFIEPGNLTVFSFAVRTDYVFEDVSKAVNIYNSFTRSTFGLGPVFALRFQTSEHVTVIPEAAYQLLYVKWRWNWLDHPIVPTPPPNQPQTENLQEEDNNFWHEAFGGINIVYRLNESNAVNFEPKLVIKAGEGRQSTDLLNATVTIGYLLSF